MLLAAGCSGLVGANTQTETDLVAAPTGILPEVVGETPWPENTPLVVPLWLPGSALPVALTCPPPIFLPSPPHPRAFSPSLP